MTCHWDEYEIRNGVRCLDLEDEGPGGRCDTYRLTETDTGGRRHVQLTQCEAGPRLNLPFVALEQLLDLFFPSVERGTIEIQFEHDVDEWESSLTITGPAPPFTDGGVLCCRRRRPAALDNRPAMP